MSEISKYHFYLLKGIAKANAGLKSAQLGAIEDFKTALTYERTSEAYSWIATCAYKIYDYDLYIKTLDEGIDYGYTHFCNVLGNFFATHKDEADKKKALYYFDKGIIAKNVLCIESLADHYYYGSKVINKDVDKALELYYVLVTTTNDSNIKSRTFFKMAEIYYERNDYENAIRYYNFAVDLNNPNACYNLGMMYLDGEGVDINIDKAIELFKKPTKPNPLAYYRLGGICLDDELGIDDTKAALVYFEMGARLLEPNCAFMAACSLHTLSRRTNRDRKLRYLEIAFKYAKEDSKLITMLDETFEFFGPSFEKELNELSDKYLGYVRSAA